MQTGRKGRLHPAVGLARNEMADTLNQLLGVGTVSASGKTRTAGSNELFLIACSGGPDSLALASVAAHFARRQDARVGAVIVDHQLQEGSDQVASTAKTQCEELGLSPVLIKKVTVASENEGPEMAARSARYCAFEEAVAETGARGVVLAHTLDDQAETVLLGLARGSGTRSLAGMPAIREHHGITYLRPLLNLRRCDIEAICAAEGLVPWRDPTNFDEKMMRAKVRHTILPFLEEQLGGDVAVSLARTAAIVGPDSDYLDQQAREILHNGPLRVPENTVSLPEQITRDSLVLDRAAVANLHPALRRRVLALAVKKLGGHAPAFERLSALDDFVGTHGVAGPLQLSGHVSVWRARPPGNYRKTGVLILGRTG